MKSYKMKKRENGKINPYWAESKVPKEWLDTFTEEENAYLKRMGHNHPDGVFLILEKKGYALDKFWKDLESLDE